MITITTDMSQHESARALAKLGIHVFPVDHPDLPQCAGLKTAEHDPAKCDGKDRGKHPAVKWGTGASTSQHNIDYWWSGHPRNLGIHCGKSGLLIIDEDEPDGFARYAADHGVAIPATFTVKTGNGRHFYFRDTENGALSLTEGALSEYGINVRSGNGFVVGPWSKHESGVLYTPENDLEPALLPSWVVNAIKAKTNGHKASGENTGWEGIRTDDFDRFELPEVIKDGKRDATLFKYASPASTQPPPQRNERTHGACVETLRTTTSRENPLCARDSFSQARPL
jgi:hypothetical protein